MTLKKTENEALNAISEAFVAYAGPLIVHCFDKDIYHSNLDDNDWETDIERWSNSQPVLRSITRATRNKPWRDVNSAMFEVCSKLIKESICPVLDAKTMMPFLNLRSALLDELVFTCVSKSVHGTDEIMSNHLLEFLSCLAENFDAPPGLLEILAKAREEIRSNDSLNIIPILNDASGYPHILSPPIIAGIKYSSRLERDCSNWLEALE